MPQLERKDLKQRALLWAATGRFDRSGQPVVAAPVEIRCRWVAGRKEVVGPDGAPLALDATVKVDRRVDVGSRLWLAPDPTTSALDQWYGTGSAGTDTEVMEVSTYNESPDLKNRFVGRQLGLVKFKDQP